MSFLTINAGHLVFGVEAAKAAWVLALPALGEEEMRGACTRQLVGLVGI